MEGIEGKQKIAVIGAGIAGISVAHMLSRTHNVTLFEKNDYLGGHTNTRTIEKSPQSTIDIDTGFIVCNPRNYPLFYEFLNQLGVKLRDSEMSFGFYCDSSELGYTGPAVRDFLGQPKNLLNIDFLRMILEQRRFNKRALRDLDSGELGNIRLGDYLSHLGVSRYFIDHYLLPLSAAIWSSPDDDMLDFPALTFVTFFRNHGMLQLSSRPTWQTVVGGSHAYIRAFQKRFPGVVRLSSPVRSVRRLQSQVSVQLADGVEEHFDRLVLGCHANESLALLQNPSSAEERLLGSWRYHRNAATLHTDSSIMPANRKLWASWNYRRPVKAVGKEPVSVTYYMNRLQGLTSKHDYFVTLNDNQKIDREKVLYETVYTHPAYTPDSVAAQKDLPELNGTNRTYYCGAYLGYGFHEDGIRSAVAVAKQFGVEL